MRKIIASMIILLVLIVGCTKTSETPTDTSKTTESMEEVKETTGDPDLSTDINEIESNELSLEELEDLDLEIDEGLFE